MKRRTRIPEDSPKIFTGSSANEDGKRRFGSFDEAVDAFLSDNLKRGLSADTNHFYIGKLKAWRTYFETVAKTPPPIHPRSAQVDAYEDYLVSVKGLSINGIKAHQRAIRRFYSYLIEVGATNRNPFANRPRIKSQDIMIETFTQTEIQRLLAVCNVSTFVGYRDYIMMNFMLDTGIRLREMTDLNVGDVNLEDENVVILGKNRMRRVAPLSKSMVAMIKKWLIVRGESSSDRLFITQNDSNMSKRAVQNRLTIYGKKAGVYKQVSPHVFRHTFAKMYIQNGGNIFVLQDLLDHSTLDMVRRYVRLFSPDLKKDHALFSPLSKM